MQRTIPSLDNLDAQSLFEHTRWMRGLAQRLATTGDQADDLVQSAWAIATKNPPNADVPLRGWLAGIMRRVALAERRAHGHRTGREQVVAAEAASDTAPATDALVALAEEKRYIIDSILSLPEDEREVILLRYYEGLAPREIAKQLGLSPHAVRALRDRGLKALRMNLDTRHDGDRRAWGIALLPLARETTAAQSALTSGAALGVFSAGMLKIAAALLVGAIMLLGVMNLLASDDSGSPVVQAGHASEVAGVGDTDATQGSGSAPETEAQTAALAPAIRAGSSTRQPATQPAATPSPKATFDVSGRVTDAVSGAALSGGVVTMERGDELSVGAMEPDGSFRTAFTNLELTGRDGMCRIKVEHKGHVTANYASLAGEPVHVKLIREATLEGTVFDDAGVPKPGAFLFLWSEDTMNNKGLPIYEEYRRRFVAEADGTFRIDGLRPGVYTLHLLERPRDPDERALVTLTVTLEVGDDKTVDVLLKDPDAVVVRGLIAPAMPVDFALVPIFFPYAPTGSMVIGVPQAGYGKGPGEFEAAGLQRGKYMVLLMPETDDYEAPFALLPLVEIDQSSPSERTMNLAYPTNQITGSLRRNAGFDGLTVVAVPVIPSGLAKSWSEGEKMLRLFGQPVASDGSFALPGIATGPYRIQVFGPELGLPVASQVVDVRGDEVLPQWELE